MSPMPRLGHISDAAQATPPETQAARAVRRQSCPLYWIPVTCLWKNIGCYRSIMGEIGGGGERADSKLFLHLFLVSMCVTKKKFLRIFNDFKGLLCRLILIRHTFKDMQNNHHVKRSYRVSSLPRKTFELLIRDCALFRVNFVVFQEVGGAGQPDSRNIGYLEI